MIYTGDQAPKIDPVQHREFLAGLSSALLAGLAERELLSKEQSRQVLKNIQRKGANICTQSQETTSSTP